MAVDSAKIKEIVSQIDQLPTLPSVVVELLKMLDNEKTQARQIADLIAHDQSLSAKVLKLVNSSYYGLPKKVSTISAAVVILGFSTIRSIVLGASVIQAFSRPGVHHGYFRAESFWDHAVGTAAAAQWLARMAEMPRSEDAFTAGLLHGCGLLILDQYFPDLMARIQEHVDQDHRTLIEAEELELGFDHAAMGAHLLGDWGLPDHIVNAVRFHTHVDQCPNDQRLAAVVHLADIFCRALGYGDAGEPTIPAVSEFALDAIGLTPASFPVILEPMDKAVEKAAIFLDRRPDH